MEWWDFAECSHKSEYEKFKEQRPSVSPSVSLNDREYDSNNSKMVQLDKSDSAICERHRLRLANHQLFFRPRNSTASNPQLTYPVRNPVSGGAFAGFSIVTKFSDGSPHPERRVTEWPHIEIVKVIRTIGTIEVLDLLEREKESIESPVPSLHKYSINSTLWSP